jgi:DNA-binding beta-propeller fold protein YncE
MMDRPTGWPMLRSLLLLVLVGCTASAVEVQPPQYDLYFPTGLAVSPDERWLFVLNANADLRYSHATLQVIDLDQVDTIATAWQGGDATGNCVPVAQRPKVLGCPLVKDGVVSPIMVKGGAVGIGNFAVAAGVQPIPGTSTLRVFATVRGDPSITWADFDTATGTLSCASGSGFKRCDEEHRLARLRNDSNYPSLPPEPFDVYVDAASQHAFVTHFTTGFVTLVQAPADLTRAPMLQDTITTLWAPNQSGLLGAVGVAARPNDPWGLVYVTSRQEARVASLAVAEGPTDAQGRPTEHLVRTQSFFQQGIERSGLNGDVRALRFSADGNQAFLVARTPPSLQIYDMTPDVDGVPRNELVGAVALCELPASLAIADFGDGLRAAMPCFPTGQVWIADTAAAKLAAVEDVGRGPTGVAMSAKHKKIYIGNYAEDTLSVIDAAPGSRSRYRVILRFGTPRQVEAN